MERRSSILAAALGAMLLAGVSTLAHAQTPTSGQSARPRSIGEMLGLRSRPPAAPVAHYVVEGVTEFTFDRSNGQSLVRFADSREILVLQPQPAPRGDVLYKNDLGDPVLRFSSLGGVTVFLPSRPEGAPAAFAGPADTLRLPPVGNAVTFGIRMSDASVRVSQVVGHLVIFDLIEDATPSNDAVYVDAANLTVEAFQRVAKRDKRADSAWRRVAQVIFGPGPKPDAVRQDRVLKIIMVPERGVAGRPSSERIARALR